VNYIQGIKGIVTVTKDEVAFAEEGGFYFNTITVNNPALIPSFLVDSSSVTFFAL
jgi:hypothetical protein